MSINFLDISCKTESSEKQFGLCDDPPPARNPAYIDEHNPAKWIAVVHNPSNKEAKFYAVDHCVEVLRTDGTQESRCDGILHYDNNLVLVELKERKGSGWSSGASSQLSTTYSNFSANHYLAEFNLVEAYVCNKLRPVANANHIGTIRLCCMAKLFAV